MSADDQGGAGRREVAYRLFAAEFEDADFSYSESDEERAPNYVVTPTGARVNRLFVVGVLTEVEQAGEDILRARIVDPTGAFVVYAGQYQPDAQAFLDRAEPPMFVAVTGKARTFQPEDSDVTYTSIRPENVNAVDAETRDRWTVQCARQTLDRVTTMADALGRDERGDDLRRVLEGRGVDVGLAAGIPLAIDHYETTPAYLEAVRTLATQAAEVVSGERDEVESFSTSPDDPGDANLPELAALDVESSVGGETESVPTADEPEAAADTATAGGSETTAESATAGEAETSAATESTESTTDADTVAATETTASTDSADEPSLTDSEPASTGDSSATVADDSTTSTAGESGTTEVAVGESDAAATGESEPATTETAGDETVGDQTTTAESATETTAAPSETESTPATDESPSTETVGQTAGETAGDELGDFDASGGTEPDATADAGADDELGDFDPGEFELDEEEREQIEEEYGTEFQSGTEVSEPGEADIETPDPEELEEEVEEIEEAEELADEAAETVSETGVSAPEAGEPTSEGQAEPDETAGDEPADTGAESTAESEPAETAENTEPAEEAESTEPEPVEETEDAEPEAAEDVDLEDAVMDAMRDLDDGDGAAEDDIVDAVVDRYGADPDEASDAIQDALMGGQCYEPEDGVFKPI